MARKRDLTPISYVRLIPVKGYTRKDGRKVQGYTRQVWVVEFPVSLDDLDLTDFGREKFPPQARIDPSPSIPSESGPWEPVQDFVLAQYDEYDHFEMKDAIYRKREDSDFISRADGFVWEEPLDSRDMDALHLQEIYLVRIWVLIYNRTRDEYFVFARARSLNLFPEATRLSLNAAYQVCLDMYNGLVEWAENDTDYLEVRRMLAWTAWGLPIGTRQPEVAPRKF